MKLIHFGFEACDVAEVDVFCRKLGRPFLPAPHPRGHEKQRLVENYYKNGKHVKKPAKGFPPEELYKAKENLSIENFNWLYISLWLGLRPKEIDSLHDKTMWRLEKTHSGQQVISIFQTKIITVPPEDRWKPIPKWPLTTSNLRVWNQLLPKLSGHRVHMFLII